jgi:hypothetical protein
VSKAAELFRDLVAIRQAHNSDVERYRVAWEQEELRLRERFGEHFDKATKNLPKGEAIREAYQITWTVMNLVAERERAGMPEELKAFLADARENLRGVVTDAVEAMVREPRKAVAEAVKNLAERIRDRGRYGQGAFDRVKEALDKFRSFAELTDDALLQSVKDVRDMISGEDPDHVKDNEDAGLALAEALESVGREAEDEVAIEATYRRFTRNVD